jgi:hypothetical protein
VPQSLNYDRSIESELSTGNRYAERGQPVSALKTLSGAHERCLAAYPPGSLIGQAHELRFRRDIAAVDARIVINGIIPDRFLNDKARAELEAASESLLTARAGLATLAFTPEGTSPIEEHLHAEAGLADIWRGRIKIAMGVLSLTQGPRAVSYNEASEYLGTAQRHIMAGNNLLYVAELFGQVMRLRTLTGGNRSEALRGAERAVAAAATRDRTRLYKIVGKVMSYGLEFTPAKVEKAIREGKL